MKILLAAIESNREHAVAARKAGAKHVLTSFFYAGYRKRNYREEWLQCLRHTKLRFIDSGAFTLRTSVLSLVSTSGAEAAADVDYDEFLTAYIKWLKWTQSMRLSDVWVEQDIAAITSYDWVHKQRDKIIAAGLGHGLINVWHSDQDWDYWVYLLKEARRPGRSGYVAIEGHQFNREPLNYTRFLKEAYDRGVKVHGFRMTSAEALQKWPFYSVDSSSWMTVSSRGTYALVPRTGGVQQTMSAKKSTGDTSLRRSWAGVMPRTGTTFGIRLDALIKSAKAWCDAEKHFDEMWRRRGVDWDKAIANPRVA